MTATGPSEERRVFLSHSSLDRKIADRLLKALEAEGLNCWVSHRDIDPGAEWAETIYDAIASSSAMILLFTGNSNESWQVRNELDIATNLKIPIIPVRFDTTPISKSVRYFTNSHQWMEAPSAGKMKSSDLVAAVKRVLETADGAARKDDPAPAITAARPAGRNFLLLALIPAVVAALLLLKAPSGGAAAPDNLFILMAGGSDSWNYASDIASTGDGGFVAAGTWDWGFWSQAWVAGFDGTLALKWSWSDSLAGECRPMILVTREREIIAGFGEYADPAHEGYSVRAVRIRGDGSVLWDSRKQIIWAGSVQPVFGDMAWNADGSITMAFTLRVLSDRSTFHSHIVTLDPSDGGMEWATIPQRSECIAFLPLAEGGAFHVYLEVESQSNGIELISPGGEVLNRIVVGDMRSQATCASLTSDQGVLLAVTGDRYGSGNGDLWLMRFSRDLELVWNRTFGGELMDSASEILALPCGGFLVVGGTRSFGDGTSDGWAIRLSADGELLWQSFLDLGGHERITAAAMEDDGSFLLAGLSNSLRGEPDALLARMSPCGAVDDTARVGLDILHEDWGRGFLDQAVWLMGRNRNYTPMVRADSSGGGFSLDLKGVPLLHRRMLAFTPGLCMSADVLIPDMPSVTGNNWFALGFTDRDINAFHSDPSSVPLVQLRWNYTPEAGSGQGSVDASCLFPEAGEPRSAPHQEWLRTGRPQNLTIETCQGSVMYRLNDSLFHQSVLPGAVPESVSAFLWGNSISLPHHVRDVRVFRRRW